MTQIKWRSGRSTLTDKGSAGNEKSFVVGANPVEVTATLRQCYSRNYNYNSK
jgi:hypothetical protein